MAMETRILGRIRVARDPCVETGIRVLILGASYRVSRTRGDHA